jgi:hypothetical protein
MESNTIEAEYMQMEEPKALQWIKQPIAGFVWFSSLSFLGVLSVLGGETFHLRQ